MGRSTRAARGSDRDLLARVLRVWAEAGQGEHNRGAVGRVLDLFSSGDVNRVRALANAPLPVELHTQNHWIKGEPTPGTPALHPIAAVSLRQKQGQDVEMTIRVALFGESPHSHIKYTLQGWRFESREPDTKDPRTNEVKKSPRPFPHAQPTLGWYMDAPCMAHSHTTEAEASSCTTNPWSDEVAQWRQLTNETQPGFPLRADTLTGQAVALLVALYGAPRVVKMFFNGDEELRRVMTTSAELRALLGLPAPEGVKA